MLLVAASAAGQTTVVSPRVFSNTAGNAANAFPFVAPAATNPVQRYLSIHDDMAGRVGTIKGLATRLKQATSTVACSFNLEVRISTASVLAASASTTFDSNHGPDKATVVPASTPFSYPAFPAVNPGPAPFTYVVPFTTPFGFAGTGGIAWEVLLDSRVMATGSQLDAADGQAVFNLSGVSFGAGCLATGRTATATCSSSYAAATGVTLTASGLTASAPGAIVLGLGMTSWLGLTLPLDLPGTSGYPSGTCRVHSDWIVELPATTGAGGGMNVQVPITLGPATFGVTLYSYGYTLDAAANGLGLVTTNARKTGLGDGLKVGGCRVQVSNNNASPTGLKDNTVLITQFWY